VRGANGLDILGYSPCMSAANPTASPRTFGALVLASLAVATACLLLFSWLAEEVFEGSTSKFDLQVRLAVHQWASPTLTQAMRALSVVGSFVFLSSLLVALVVVFLLIGWRRAAIWLAIATAGGAILESTLKLLFQRARPLAFFGPDPRTYSFPSGHALASFCFYGVLAGLLTTRIQKRWLRVVIWAAAALLVTGIGFSRIYLGVHWPTDVIAGYAAAAVWVGGLIVLDRLFQHRKRRRRGAVSAVEGQK